MRSPPARIQNDTDKKILGCYWNTWWWASCSCVCPSHTLPNLSGHSNKQVKEIFKFKNMHSSDQCSKRKAGKPKAKGLCTNTRSHSWLHNAGVCSSKTSHTFAESKRPCEASRAVSSHIIPCNHCYNHNTQAQNHFQIDDDNINHHSSWKSG